MPTSLSIPAAALAVATLAAVGLLGLAAKDIGSVLAWAYVPVPLLLGGGAAYHATRAAQRGDKKSAEALIGWSIMANAFVAFLAGMLE